MSALVYPTRPTVTDFLILDEPPHDAFSGDTEELLPIAIVNVGDDDEPDWRDLESGGV